MKTKFLIVSSIMLFLIASCKKQIPIPIDSDQLTPPAGFLWEMSHNVDLTISINDPRFDNALHSISVYDQDPQNGGTLIAKGSAANNQPFVTKMYLADTLKSLLAIKTAPDGSAMQQEITLSGASAATTIGVVPVPSFKPLEGPDCATGCSRSITASNNNINVANGETVCITGNNITVGFTANNNGTVRICGTNVTVNNATLNNGSKLIITATGSANLPSFNINTGIRFENYGTCTTNSGVSPSGTLLNNGTLNMGGNLSVNSGGLLTNRGNIKINGSIDVNSKGNSNSGTITCKTFTLNSGGDFTNLCTLGINGDYNNNGTMLNYQLVTVTGTTKVTSRSELGLYNSAMHTTKDLELNGKIAGYGTTSIVKTSGRTTINSGGSAKGSVQYCDANGIETNNPGAAAFTGGAVQACNVYIPTNACNSTGNGRPIIPDADGDGVSDALDEYPTLAGKAFNNYYPSASGRAVVAFEDLWPSKGDYDFNDLVMDYRHNIVTNAANKVAAINSSYTLLATGGSFRNAFGVEFPLASSKISAVTGGTTEPGQSNAVIILFDNMRSQMLYYNTVATQPESATVNYNTSFEVTDGPLLSSFGLGAYNPFIWNNTSAATAGRNEIHLPGHAPTSLGSTALFSTKDDNSRVANGRYYLTKTGMPWALTLPAAFKYPKESTKIIEAYPYFSNWANSGGKDYPNWYSSINGFITITAVYKP